MYIHPFELITVLVLVTCVLFIALRAFRRESEHWERVAEELAGVEQAEREAVLSQLHHSERKKVLEKLRHRSNNNEFSAS
jgi:hypothetical protein